MALTKQMCDLKTISEYLNVSVPYIRKLVRAKMIPYYKFGNRLKFDIEEINGWIELHRQEERKSILLL